MVDKIKVDVEVSSNIDEQTRSAKILRKELEGAQKATTGGSGMSKAAHETKTFAAAAESAATSSERLGYGIARAAVGTGAAGRDFAKQAQGLGGLVHVYATFAANLFAVGAAFTALKNAADTASMVKGLDQLGAASGMALGSLSKEVVKLTDGAVTMREAMEATAKATAAGMSSADLKRLATGAKNASQALGVDMSDALSRLSRGITKLEPELLDELGIFVRVDKAAADYARTLGKPASALTDFEKRAAFAAATLEQVENKFGAIKLDANPYNQLLASLKEVMQTGLEVINTFLEPVLRMLASSPTALAIAMAGVGTALLKQAIPALSSFKESMRAAADQATKLANIKAVEAIGAKRAALKEKELQIESKIDDEIQKVTIAEEKLGKLRETNINKNTAAYKLLQKTMEVGAVYTEEDFAKVEKAAKRAAAAGDIDKASVYREVAAAVQGTIKAEDELAAAKDRHTKEIMSQASATSTLGMIQRITDKANQEAAKRQIISNVAYTASIEGPIAALKRLHKETQLARQASTRDIEVGTGAFDAQGKEITRVEKIAIKGLSNIKTATTYISGALTTATTAVGTFMNAFSGWMAFAGLITAAFGILDSYMSNTNRQAKDSASALDSIAMAGENASRVLDRLSTLDFSERLSVENIQARSTALTELANSLVDAVNKVNSQVEAMNPWDKAIDDFKSLLNLDIRDNLADNLSEGIANAFKLAGDSPAAKTAKERLTSILGTVDITDTDALKNKLEELAKSGALTSGVMKQVTDSITEMARAQGTAAAKGTELKAAMETTNKAAQDVINAFLPSDNISKFGMAIMAESSKMQAALEEPSQQLNALKAILETPAQLAILGDTGSQLLTISSDIDTAITKTAAYTAAIENTQKSIDKLNAANTKYEKFKSQPQVSEGGVKYYDTLIKKNNELIGSYQEAITTYKNAQEDVAKEMADTLEGKGINITQISKTLFSEGAKYFSQGIAVEMGKAAALISKAYTGLAPSSATASLVNVRADNAQLQLEKELINSNIGLIDAMYENTQATQKNTLINEKRAEEAKLFPDTKKLQQLDRSIAQIEKSQSYVAADKERVKSGGKPVDIASLEGVGLDSATLARYMQLAGSNAAIYNKNMQMAANNVKLAIDQAKIKHDYDMRDLDASKAENDLSLKRISSINIANGLMAPQLLIMKQTLELKNQELESEKSIANATFERNNLLKLIEQTGMKGTEAANKDIEAADTKLRLAKETAQTSKEELATRQRLETATNQINIQRESLAIEQQKLDALASIGVAISSETIIQQGLEQSRLMELEHLAKKQAIEGQINAARASGQADLAAALTAQLDYEDKLYEKRKQSLDITTQIKAAQADIGQITNSFNAIFDQLNGAAGGFADSLLKAQVVSEVYGKELKNNTEAQKKAQKIIDDEATSAEQKRDAFDDLVNLKKDETKLTKAGQAAQLKADAAMIGSAKKLFNEKSVAYKVLGGIEKAMHIASLAMEAEKIAVAIAGMAERIPAYAAEIYGATIGQLGPIAGPIVATALVATLVAMAAAAGGGGGGVSMPAPPSYEDLQNVQGTGQDYVVDKTTGITTTVLEVNAGGVLGDIAAKSEDIANSIDYMESYSFETLIYNNKMLTALKDIEVNTKNFVSALASAGFTGENSPLGTIAQTTSSSGVNIGLGPISLFSGGGSSSSSSVEDWGIQLVGQLGSLINGVGKMVAYDLVKTVTTTTKSSFLGMGGGTSTDTRYNTNEKVLSDNMKQSIQKIMYDVSETVLAYGAKLSTRTREELQSFLDQQTVDFKISTKGMTGQEIYDAILAELGITTNKLVAAAYPFLTAVQDFGEGLLTTLIRVTTNMQTVDVMFKQMGIDFAKSFLIPVDDVIAQNKVRDEKLAAAQKKIDDAKAALEYKRITGYGQVLVQASEDFWAEEATVLMDRPFAAMYNTVDEFIRGLQEQANMSTAYYVSWADWSYGEDPNRVAIRDAARATLTEYYAAIEEAAGIRATNPGQDVLLKNITVYEDLIDRFGGDLQVFVDKTQFYIDNFVDANTVLTAHYDAVGQELQRLDKAYTRPKINISAANTIEEIWTAVESSVDKSSEIGKVLLRALDSENRNKAGWGVGAIIEPIVNNINAYLAAIPDIDLTTINTRAEFNRLVNSLDLASESGRQLYVDLMNLAPGFDVIVKHLEDVMNKAGLSAEDFNNKLLSAIKGEVDASTIGKEISNSIYDGVMQTISTSYVENIGKLLVEQIVTPIISSAIAGNTIVGAVSKQTLDNVKNVAIASAQLLGQIFSDTEFKTALNDLSNTVGDIVRSFADIAVREDTSAKAISDMISKIGLAASNFNTLLLDGLKGNLDSTTIGKNVANTIFDGVMQAISTSYVDNIGALLVDNIVTPIIRAAIAGNTIVGAVSLQTMQNVRNVAVASAQMLGAIFSDEAFIAALRNMSDQVGAIVTSFNDLARTSGNASASVKEMTDLLSRSGLAASNFSSILKDAILGNIAVSEIGTKVAETINNGILNAISDKYITAISQLITDNIITPMITAITTGAAVTSVVTEATLDNIRLAAARAAAAISAVFSDPTILATISSVVSTITDSMKLMASTAQLSSGSITKIIAKTNTKVIDAYKKQASEITSTISKLKGFSDSLKDFRESLLTGSLSTLTPQQKYQKALEDLNTTYALAMSGDEDAISRLKDVASTFLDMSAEYYASSDAYVADFNRVQEILSTAIGSIDSQVTIYEAQLAVANNQLAKLGYIDDTTKSIEQLLREAQQIQREEVGNVLSSGFVQLDKNLDGLLGVDELRAANLASDAELTDIYRLLDTNSDGQISALEALQSATEGTVYSINSLAPILLGIQNGTISVERAIQYLATINQANAGVGGGTITVDFTKYLPTTPGGTDTGTGTGTETGVGYAGALDQVYNILGAAKNPADMRFWSEELLAGRQTIDTLLQSVLERALGQGDPGATAWVTDYVEGAYQRVLGREGDTEGITFWANAIKSGGLKVKDLYTTFSKSEEAIQKGVNNLDDYVTRAYEVVLGRRPDPAGLEYWKTAIATGQMYIGDLYATFRRSNEFISTIRDQIFGMGTDINANTVTGATSPTTSGAALSAVNSAYSTVLGRNADSEGLTFWTNAAISSNMALSDVDTMLANAAISQGNTADAIAANAWSAVNSAYSTVLGRQADEGGLQWWTQQIRSGALDIANIRMSLAQTAASQQNTADAYAAIAWLRSQGVPGYATGGMHNGGLRIVGENGPELEATGSARIWTAEQTRSMLNGITNRNNHNGELIAEIQKLNQKIEDLERTVQQGDIMNAQATERNTNQVSTTIKDTSSKANYADRLQTRATIV